MTCREAVRTQIVVKIRWWSVGYNGRFRRDFDGEKQGEKDSKNQGENWLKMP